ncbi:iron-containing alcohol dehydrogenase family protein [Oceanirhabdus sp. W0125-5]|uniref:iron-containing alcohol dehydrogenase family protein n=1 Tax=Oceanirhabdus sp. W0125-5 TaxID=2999116 RepID=UPI0022F2EC20|nr:iron-containing alcohol dehydrogenase family protein [Oceanirhabdus sp. W0125-5]WBW98408.1 iron-containing alcohol dehydrogenase family protein [Oceanirhabdus sp. W0125-5]
MLSKSHRISIPNILLNSEGAINKLGKELNKSKFKSIILFWDENIKKLFGEKIRELIEIENIKLQECIIAEVEVCNIVEKAFNLPMDVDCFVGIGGGKVIDIAKYMGFLKKKPFISIPTSTSNDGFCSPVASLLVNGRRTTVPAKIPYGILVDTNIIKTSPDRFKYSGIGDLVSNITALWDWKYEEKQGVGKIDDFAVMISSTCVNGFMNSPFNNIKEEKLLKTLVDSLTLNGIAMEISGSSAPASGSEHLISHAMDKILEKPYLHGIQVGVATYLVSLVQNNRSNEIRDVLKKTGFFDYVETLEMKRELFMKAIDLAPEIKKQRRTIIHEEESRNLAKSFLYEDIILKHLLK